MYDKHLLTVCCAHSVYCLLFAMKNCHAFADCFANVKVFGKFLHVNPMKGFSEDKKSNIRY